MGHIRPTRELTVLDRTSLIDPLQARVEADFEALESVESPGMPVSPRHVSGEWLDEDVPELDHRFGLDVVRSVVLQADETCPGAPIVGFTLERHDEVGVDVVEGPAVQGHGDTGALVEDLVGIPFTDGQKCLVISAGNRAVEATGQLIGAQGGARDGLPVEIIQNLNLATGEGRVRSVA